MTFNVRLTAGAKADLGEILQWLYERSPAGAESWHRSWLEAQETLSERAAELGTAPESQHQPEEIRQLLFKTRRGRTYRALFILRDDTVHVLPIRGPGQNRIRAEDLRNP